jgi:hypothetical protein
MELTIVALMVDDWAELSPQELPSWWKMYP